MTTLSDFMERPWEQSHLHPAYRDSFLSMRPAPEYATGEVVLASTYRSLGFRSSDITEGKVPALGRAFQKSLDRGRRPGGDAASTGLPIEAWKRIISGTLRSPKQPNQTTQRFLQISPVVPDASIYSLSARLSANSWNPGELVRRTILFGEPDVSSAKQLWLSFFHSLDVTSDDDIWARFLQQEFQSWRAQDKLNSWVAPTDLEPEEPIRRWHRSHVETPSTQFVKDLRRVLSLKKQLTRRQWISLVESLLRIGTASHIQWLCRANSVIFKHMRLCLSQGIVPDETQVNDSLSGRISFWRLGQLSSGAINDAATSYIKARAGINLLLFMADTLRPPPPDSLSSSSHIVDLLRLIASSRDVITPERFFEAYARLLESEQRAVSGKKGIASNVQEFLGHVLRQRHTAEPGLDSYDQGYFLNKRGASTNAPWQVALGPVAVLAIVHAVTCGTSAPRTVDDLCDHLLCYGIDVKPQDVPDSRLGRTLRSLGLVLDSPDAEGGMVVLNPFSQTREASI